MEKLLSAALLRLTGWESTTLSATGGVYAGVDVSAGSPFLGVQGRLNLKNAPALAAISFEGSPLSNTDRWQLNADALHHFGEVSAPFTPYAGAGLCLVRSAYNGKTSVGINLIGGASVKLGPLNGFVQLRLTFADGVHASLTGGAIPPPR